jgi:hypothetical protein
VFKFTPLQFVTIHVFGLNCEGRVLRCIQKSGPNAYEVEYCLNGDLKRWEFHEDEISPK